jgi:hypothetical protein
MIGSLAPCRTVSRNLDCVGWRGGKRRLSVSCNSLSDAFPRISGIRTGVRKCAVIRTHVRGPAISDVPGESGWCRGAGQFSIAEFSRTLHINSPAYDVITADARRPENLPVGGDRGVQASTDSPAAVGPSPFRPLVLIPRDSCRKARETIKRNPDQRPSTRGWDLSAFIFLGSITSPFFTMVVPPRGSGWAIPYLP